MKTYEVTGRALTVAAGSIVELTDGQVRRRAHKLRGLRGRRYEVLAATQFKHGERVTLAGELPKALASQVAALDAQAPDRSPGRAATSSGGRGGGTRSAPDAASDDREAAESAPAGALRRARDEGEA